MFIKCPISNCPFNLLTTFSKDWDKHHCYNDHYSIYVSKNKITLRESLTLEDYYIVNTYHKFPSFWKEPGCDIIKIEHLGPKSFHQEILHINSPFPNLLDITVKDIEALIIFQ